MPFFIYEGFAVIVLTIYRIVVIAFYMKKVVLKQVC